MLRFRLTACATVLLAALCAAPALAQQAGVVVALVDAGTGQPVADAEVEIANPDIGLRRVLRSDAKGLLRLDGLSTAGTYRIATLGGGNYSASVPVDLVLRSNFTGTVTLRLRSGAAAPIVVTGTRTKTINTVNAEVSASLRREELTALPIEGRDVIGALVRLPNVVASTGFFPEAPAISINGANALETSYLIDGLDNNENFLGGPKFPVPLGFTRDVTVLANSYSVAYGRTENGVVNYTSPAGGNEYHGEVYALIRPGRPLDAQSPYPRRDLTGNPVGESFERYQAGASLSGPLQRDKTFFYANFEYTRDRNLQVVDAPLLGTVANVTGHNQFSLGSLRIDHRLTDDWTIGLRANVGRIAVDRPGGGLGGGNNTFPSAGSFEDRNSALVAVTASYAGDSWSYDGALQFSRFRWNYGRAKGAPGPQVVVRDPSGLVAGVVGNPGFVFDDVEKTWQTTQRLQRKLGSHKLSLGADLVHSDFALLGGGNALGNYTVDLTNAQLSSLSAAGKGLALTAQDVLALNPAVSSYSVELRPQSFGTGQTQLAFYVEDQWQIDAHLTATLGLRWDYDSLTSKGGKGGDKDNFAPRLALNFRPDARSTLRAGAGIFYGKLPYSVVSDALQRNTTAPAFLAQLGQLKSLGIIPAGTDLSKVSFDGNLTVSPACTTVAACPSPTQVQALRATASVGEARILNPVGYQSPWSLQLSGGYQFEISDTLTVSADLIYSRSHNLVRLRDLNAPAPFSPNLANLTAANIALLQGQTSNAARLTLAQSLGLVRSQAAADATRPVVVVPGGAKSITVSETGGQSEYKALVLQVNKAKGSDFYAFRISYTLSSLKNDTDDINFRAANANLFSAEWGPSINDRHHVISAVAYLYPASGLKMSVAGLFQSGQPVNLVPDARIFGTQDLNGDGTSFGENYLGNSDRYPGVTRNSARLPWSASVDIGLRYAIPALGGRMELSADVFNVFNANNQSGFANAAATSNQIQFGNGAPFAQRNAGAPRQFQFGAAYKF